MQADAACHVIRRVVVSSAEVTTIAGSGAMAYADGVGTVASFFGPLSITIDAAGTTILIVSSLSGC